jgi:PAS domain S-box-containing protein
MSKKKPVAKRLNKLFENIKPEDTAYDSRRAPAGKPDPEDAAAPAIQEASQVSPHTRRLEIVPPAPKPPNGLALAFQTERNKWATLQVLDETNQRQWSADDELLVQQVADQLSLALENARLFQETQARAAELSVLNEVGQALAATLNIGQITEITYGGIRRLFDAKNFYVAFYDQENNEIIFPQNVTDSVIDRSITRLPMDKGITAHMIRMRESVLISNGSDKWMQEHGETPVGEPAKSFMGVPLILGDKVLGALAIQDYHVEHRYNEHDLRLFTSLASQTAIAIQNARLFEETRKSESELKALFAAMQDVVLVVDKDTRYTRIVPTNPSLLFRPPEELLGKRMDEILPSETHEPFRSAIRRTLETNEVVNIEYKLPIEGVEYWFLANLSKLNENEVFWVAHDITERKRAEEALQRRSTYLAASAEIGRLVTSTLDLNTIFPQTAGLLSERFGFYFAAVYNIEETGFNAILRGATGSAGRQMLASNHSVVVGSQSIVGMVAESGKPRLVENVKAEPYFDPNPLLPETQSEVAIPLRVGPRTVGVIDIHSNQPHAFTHDDLAVLQSLGDQVAVAIDNARSYELSQQLIKDLREIDKLKSQFLANMSHELRTPLNSIIGFSRVILKGIDGPVTDMQQQDLTAIYNSGQHLLGLINDILDLARIEAGKMELNFEEVSLGDMVASVLSTAKGLVKEKPIQLVQRVSPNMPAVRGDTMRVRQIFINLLSNAAKFTEEGTIAVEASVQRNPAGKMEALINVIDTGPGISLEDQEKLFKAFSQVDGSATRRTGGSGLGLSICANLVQLHGGRIGVHSESGKGSTFWFTLPLFDQPLADIPTGKKVVLAIDDDPQVISLYERYLNPQGYFVLPLVNPTRAKQRILEIRPFAITLDIMMPNTNGWDILTDLKSDPATRDIPVIVCSILDQADRGFSLGATDYLVKPILEEDLVQALDRLNRDGSIRDILVIDDDPDDLRLIEKIVDQHGNFKTRIADGGRKGWEAIHTRPPDAIILDIFMPDMDGFTILEKMRENPALREIPVLVVSGGGLTDEQQNQLSDLGRRLITKGSLKEKELIASIEHALNRAGR